MTEQPPFPLPADEATTEPASDTDAQIGKVADIMAALSECLAGFKKINAKARLSQRED